MLADLPPPGELRHGDQASVHTDMVGFSAVLPLVVLSDPAASGELWHGGLGFVRRQTTCKRNENGVA